GGARARNRGQRDSCGRRHPAQGAARDAADAGFCREPEKTGDRRLTTALRTVYRKDAKYAKKRIILKNVCALCVFAVRTNIWRYYDRHRGIVGAGCNRWTL